MNNTKSKYGQTMYHRTLSNGLNVFLFPKKGFQKKYAMYSVNFGSQDSVFSFDGELCKTPAGVAHFLEHKVFEQKDGNALQMFAATGASPNAFTSRTMTAYHFECTDGFFENLGILLRFVNNPYFTPENVQKEQGIIGQEIDMVNDNAGWIAYNSLYRALYPEHTIRESIIGTAQSIAQITDELLYKCHGTFYRPENMVLTVCGDVNFDKVCETAEKIVPNKPMPNVERIYDTGDKRTDGRVEPTSNMEIFTPTFLAGFRDVPPASGDSFRKHVLKANLAAEYIAGTLSPLYNDLYYQNIIKRDFGVEYSPFAGGGVLMAGGDSTQPKLVCERLLKAADDVRKGKLDKKMLDCVKKSQYGFETRIVDLPESLCTEQTEAFFRKTDFLNDFSVFDIDENSVCDYISNVISENNYDVATVYPSERSDS